MREWPGAGIKRQKKGGRKGEKTLGGVGEGGSFFFGILMKPAFSQGRSYQVATQSGFREL